jgi:hypothetical protein
LIKNTIEAAWKKINCFSCNAEVPDIDGVVHRYMDSSPGCWKLFGQILEKATTNKTIEKAH